MKKHFKSIIAAGLLLSGLLISPISAMAVNWGVGIDSSGNVGVAVGSGGGFGGGWQLANPYGLPSGSILGIASNLLFWLLALFAVLGVIGFVLSGIFYLLAGADEGNAEKGKEGMKWSIIGIIVGLSGFIIMQAVSSLLGGASKTF
ncbi:MAG: hypothetical protein PHW24_02755 [Candidatus Moranbacteria bacterium]|nr:hypothetical protein [Candidatus Moranbacteria bacterium]